ncbi:mitochondrial inner membrane protease subunit 1-like isoform X1 [Sinocyclocheilus anshuiensis]|uniref:Mitochondrial inner membrane protease subunit n=1 Tax=Sinocyclocheilus anshuiensis TaxID=1608454 RepID=A0A671T4H3_9TELE|nr:PREDICTED: mitochondrial inner membrane protease subunit 1-like isoform X1 [Sinocyclocheilus anshuiensis]XP_016315008.1 PREDICTED: mitochondrial inner membrane protease subunit 1-like isoform X1 [Sinocyclocheilus anshuiensis]
MFRGFFVKTISFVGYTVQYGCIAHCAFEYIGKFVSCSGPSMEPTITNHDVFFSERVSRHLCRIQKGDIVIAKSPFDPKMNICKRVIGLEGDKVCTSGSSDVFKTHTYVPRGHVWLEGDSLQNSTDSRSYGPIPYALIRGRVCLKVMRIQSHFLTYTLPQRPNHKLFEFELLPFYVVFFNESQTSSTNYPFLILLLFEIANK